MEDVKNTGTLELSRIQVKDGQTHVYLRKDAFKALRANPGDEISVIADPANERLIITRLHTNDSSGTQTD